MQEMLRKYAKLLLEKCLCIKDGQPLLINAPVEVYEFVRILTEEACLCGVRDIYYDWYDDQNKHSELKYFNNQDICNSKFWDKSIYNEYAKRDGAFLILVSNSNINMDDITEEKMMVASRNSLITRGEYRKLQENNEIAWCIAAVATKEWANLVFNNKLNDTTSLWNKICEICLVNNDNPNDLWNDKMKVNHLMCDKLNSLRIKELHYKNSLGTDLVIGLDRDALWCGGWSIIKDRELIVNMPTEEVFTTPNKFLTNGVVYTSMPLVHQGVLIKDICLEFKNGKVINYSASEGVSELKNIITLDDEALMLGEAALVDKNSLIKKSGLLFYETLFDENAACHIALGCGFKECLKNGNGLTSEELEDKGYNKSRNHVDIMIGTDDMNITAVTYDGKEIKIFDNGTFVI